MSEFGLKRREPRGIFFDKNVLETRRQQESLKKDSTDAKSKEGKLIKRFTLATCEVDGPEDASLPELLLDED